MSKTEQKGEGGGVEQLDLGERLHTFVDTLVESRPTPADLAEAAKALLERKLSGAGTKQETRLHLERIVGSLLDRLLLQAGDNDLPPGVDALESVLATVLCSNTLAEFASGIDREILACGATREYSIAGRADFISLEEVLQLLGGGNHRGCLTLEKPDSRLDLYLDNRTIAFFAPHRMVRRVLPTNGLNYREIPIAAIRRAEAAHAADGEPIFLALANDGVFREEELSDVMRQIGCEVMYEFLREQRHCAYTYRQMDELPAFALRYNIRMPITPVLLEGNKRLDDWQNMSRVFPDPRAPVQPVDDMITKISTLDLSVLEIKMLTQIDGRVTPVQLVENVGLPLHDIYHHLIRFAKAGAIQPGAEDGNLEEVACSIEESMQMAFEALDANDDEMAVANALDKVLGGLDVFGDDTPAAEPVVAPRLHIFDE